MNSAFPNTAKYLSAIDLFSADKLDVTTKELLSDPSAYERASQALRRRFSRGAEEVDAIDRGGRKTKIKREEAGAKYKYYVKGANGDWISPDERIWIVAMYALWQASKSQG